MPKMFRQGDLLFTAIETLPGKLRERETKVILEGEATGHSHRLLEGCVLEDARGELFLKVLKATQVVHQEHGAIQLEPGLYRVTRQREYQPDEIGFRTVLD